MRLVALQTVPGRIDLLIRRERFATYRYGGETLPGFTALYAPGERAITPADENGVGLWLGHGSVNGLTFALGAPNKASPPPSEGEATNSSPSPYEGEGRGGVRPLPFSPQTWGAGEASSPLKLGGPGGRKARGRIVALETVARRGSQTVGLQQECAWIDSVGRTLLTDARTVRALPGSGTGRTLDLTVSLQASEELPVTFGRSEYGVLMMRAASAFFAEGTGQVRNSQGDYGPAEIHGHSAAWCACVGVIQGATVGFALLDHPANPYHPPIWTCQEDGLLSPTMGNGLELPPGRALMLRYRLLVHEGYVEAGWAEARLSEFSSE